MNALHESARDLPTELRLLRQAIGDLAVIMTAKMELSGPAVLDMKDAATYLSTTKNSLYDLVNRGGIPCRRIGRKYVFLKADIDAWLQQLPGITVAQAIAAIKPEHLTMYVRQSARISHEDPDATSGLPIMLVRGPKGRNRERLKEIQT
jgi:excisionase family DNA binding protein